MAASVHAAEPVTCRALLKTQFLKRITNVPLITVVEGRPRAAGLLPERYYAVNLGDKAIFIPEEVAFYFLSNFKTPELGGATEVVFADIVSRVIQSHPESIRTIEKLAEDPENRQLMDQFTKLANSVSVVSVYSTVIEEIPRLFLWQHGTMKEIFFDPVLSVTLLEKILKPAPVQGLKTISKQEALAALAALYNRAVERGHEVIEVDRKPETTSFVPSIWYLNKALSIFTEEKLGRYIITSVRYYGRMPQFRALGFEDPWEVVRLKTGDTATEPGLGKTQRLLLIDLAEKHFYHLGYDELLIARFALPKLPGVQRRLIERSLTETRLSDRSVQPVDIVLKTVFELRLDETERPFDLSNTYLAADILEGLFR